jgi:hypothetical protein
VAAGGVDSFKGYFDVGVFKYVGNLFCFMSEIRECDPFLFVCLFVFSSFFGDVSVCYVVLV